MRTPGIGARRPWRRREGSTDELSAPMPGLDTAGQTSAGRPSLERFELVLILVIILLLASTAAIAAGLIG